MDAPDIHIRIPRKLYELINNLVVKDRYYRSAPEFILECARNRVEEIKRYRIDQRKIRALEKANTRSIAHKDVSGTTHSDLRISKSD
jgi:Arc/MetJ-type ribon-helix-helix transcriptional regulator